MIRTSLKLLAALIVLILVVGVWLVLPAFREPGESTLTSQQLQMLRFVPSTAREVFILPSVASLHYHLRTDDLTKGIVNDMEARRGLGLLPLLLGNSDVLVWRDQDKELSYVARLDAVRRNVVAIYLAVSGSDLELRRHGSEVIVGREAAEPVDWTSALVPGGRMSGHAFVFQAASSNAPFPPIGRPAWTSVTVGQKTIELVSRSPRSSIVSAGLPALPVPHGPMLCAVVSSAPSFIDDLEDALPVRISPLLERGALFALYRIEERSLLPRPYGVIVFPGDEIRIGELISALDSMVPRMPLSTKEERSFAGTTIVRSQGIGFTVEYARRPEQLVLAFDKSSVERYLLDEFDPPRELDAEWTLQIDPAQAVPALGQIRGHKGLRFIARDLSESVDDLYRSARWFSEAESIRARKRRDGEGEVLLVTIAKRNS